MIIQIDGSVGGTGGTAFNAVEGVCTCGGVTEIRGDGVGTAGRVIKYTCEVNGSVVGAGTRVLIHDSEVFGFRGV